jgi:hypothetical protein
VGLVAGPFYFLLNSLILRSLSSELKICDPIEILWQPLGLKRLADAGDPVGVFSEDPDQSPSWFFSDPSIREQGRQSTDLDET